MSSMNHGFRSAAQLRLWRSFTVTISDVMVRAWKLSGYIPPVLAFILEPERARHLRHLRFSYKPHPSGFIGALDFHPSEFRSFLLGIRPHLRLFPGLHSLSLPHVYFNWIAWALRDHLIDADTGRGMSFWQEHPGIQSLGFAQATYTHVRLVIEYEELPALKYLVPPSPQHLEIVMNRPVLGVSLSMSDEQDWDVLGSYLNESTGPLRALRLKNCDVSPTAEVLVPFITSIKTLVELELSQFAMPSSDDRAVAIKGFSHLPDLQVLSWNSTWEEKECLWREFDAVNASSSEAFPGLRYVSFGAPMKSNPARYRTPHTANSTGVSVWAGWMPTLLCSWEVGEHLANLHHIIDD